MKQQEAVTQNRIAYFDYLRILAIFAVIVVHVAAQNWYTTSPKSWDWQVFNIYSSAFRYALPTFIMMSGALCLRSTYSIKKIVFKNVLRFLTAYIFWAAFYAVFYLIKGDYSIMGTIDGFLTGHYHLWYLSTIAALYLCIPLLKPIAESETSFKFCLILSLLFGCIIPQIHDLIALMPPSLAQRVFIRFTSFIPVPLSENLFYFMLGYYLYKTEIPKSRRKLLYCGGIAGILFTIIATSVISCWKGEPYPYVYLHRTVNIVIINIAFFVFGKYHLSFENLRPGWLRLVKALSNYSFGVYLIHAFFIEALDFYFHWNTLSFSPILSVPVISLVVAVLSFSTSALIHRIPIIRKYIV